LNPDPFILVPYPELDPIKRFGSLRIRIRNSAGKRGTGTECGFLLSSLPVSDGERIADLLALVVHHLLQHASRLSVEVGELAVLRLHLLLRADLVVAH
jgi:hypothetical protein